MQRQRSARASLCTAVGRSGTGRALSEHTGRGLLTLVDDTASPDGAGEWLAAQQLGPVKVVRLPENVGFGSGHNCCQLVVVHHLFGEPGCSRWTTTPFQSCARGWTLTGCGDGDAPAVPNGAEQYTAQAQLSGAAGLAGSAAVFEGRGTALSDAGRSVPPW